MKAIGELVDRSLFMVIVGYSSIDLVGNCTGAVDQGGS